MDSADPRAVMFFGDDCICDDSYDCYYEEDGDCLECRHYSPQPLTISDQCATISTEANERKVRP